MNLSRLRNLAIITASLIIAGVAGYAFGHRPTSLVATPSSKTTDLTVFWDVWHKLSSDYLDKKALNEQQMVNGAIKGLVSSLGDPYTVYLSSEENKAAKEDLNGSFEGVGIQLGYDKDNRLAVVAPLAGTPAALAGIRAGDLILKIGEKTTEGMSLPEAVKLIRGPKGTRVKLTLLRSDAKEPFAVDLERATIVVVSVELEFKNNLAHLKLVRFGDRTEEEWYQAVAKVVSGKPQGVIFDLRDNPGGYLSGAVFVASEFLTSGVIVRQESQKGVQEDYSVNRQGQLTHFPLAVLINSGSASASEIVAGALRDHRRAKIVGEKSFGKGTVQEAEDLPGGAGLHITIARWLTPNGQSIDKQGIKPNFEVKNNPEMPDQDLQLAKATEILLK